MIYITKFIYKKKKKEKLLNTYNLKFNFIEVIKPRVANGNQFILIEQKINNMRSCSIYIAWMLWIRLDYVENNGICFI